MSTNIFRYALTLLSVSLSEACTKLPTSPTLQLLHRCYIFLHFGVLKDSDATLPAHTFPSNHQCLSFYVSMPIQPLLIIDSNQILSNLRQYQITASSSKNRRFC